MAVPRVCVLRAPGTNCDSETAHAFELCGGIAERHHLFSVIESPEVLDRFQILCIPGGFSYGDDIGSGVIFASQLRTRLRDALGRFLLGDRLVLGICNGFQTLLKAGVLPYGAVGWGSAGREEADATLTWNENGRYTARWIRLKVGRTNNVFLRDIDEIDLPMAHAEGRLVVKSPDVLSRWETAGQSALRYIPWQAHVSSTEKSQWHSDRYPTNPNGSVDDLAGLGDASGKVLGLMPHPERFLFGTQHPNWTRLGLGEIGDGRKFFENAVSYFA